MEMVSFGGRIALRGIIAIAASASSIAFASTPALPAPTYQGTVYDIPGQYGFYVTGPVDVSSPNTSLKVTAAPLPTINATASGADIGSNCCFFNTFSYAVINYNFRLSGPDVVVPMLVHVKMDVSSVEANGDSVNAYSMFSLFTSIDSLSKRIELVNTTGATSYDQVLSFNIRPGDLAGVRLAANASLLTLGSAGSSARAFIDPVIEVDPAFANAANYSLSFSPSIGNVAPVPEPGEWAMIVAGLGLVGTTVRRRRKQV